MVQNPQTPSKDGFAKVPNRSGNGIEPPHPDDPILKLDNVIVTPHALCWTGQMFEGIGAKDVQAVLELSRGQVPAGIVNGVVLDNPIWQQRLARYAVS